MDKISEENAALMRKGLLATDQIRQGDVFVRRVDKVPEGAKPIAKDNGSNVLAHGEVTGHAHRVVERQAEMFSAGGATFLVVPVTSELVHEEHDKIPHTPGTYEVTIQREYDEATEERQVQD